jgi:hypothetical protein
MSSRQDRPGRGRRAQPPRRRERPHHLREPEPRADGWRAQVAWRSASAATQSLMAHHNPKVMRNCHSLHGPWRRASSTRASSAGAVTATSTSTSSPSRRRSTTACSIAPSSSSPRTRTISPAVEKSALKALIFTPRQDARRPRARRLPRVPSPYGVTGRLRRRDRGGPRAHHAQALLRAVPRAGVGQADILVCGVPNISPYNVQLVPEPAARAGHGARVPVQHVQGRADGEEGRHDDRAHPCTDKFDNEQHAPYIEFVHGSAAGDPRRPRAAQALRGEVRREPCLRGDVPHGPRVPPGAPLLHVVLGRGRAPARGAQ